MTHPTTSLSELNRCAVLRGFRKGPGKVLARMAAAIFALGMVTNAVAGDCLRDSYGRVVCGRAQCLTDEYGKVYCAREGGSAMREQYGKVVCGVGYCAADEWGRVICSTRPGGNALMDIDGKVVCENSCQAASAQMCEGPIRPDELKPGH